MLNRVFINDIMSNVCPTSWQVRHCAGVAEPCMCNSAEERALGETDHASCSADSRPRAKTSAVPVASSQRTISCPCALTGPALNRHPRLATQCLLDLRRRSSDPSLLPPPIPPPRRSNLSAMPTNRPLLSKRPSTDSSGDLDMDEEKESLLTGLPTRRTASPGSRLWRFWRELGLFVWAVVATALVVVLATVLQKTAQDATHGSSQPTGKRNLIFMVSDGMGPTSLSLARSFMQFQNGLPFSKQLVIDQHLIGQSRTRSSSSLVTDSAAGATAFSCALKSYNGAISVTPDHLPCGTVLEAAKKAGYMTGLVVTTRITDATPACFAAHVNMRQEEDRIAEQMVGDYPLGRVVDLMFGGGRCHFVPNSTVESSCRLDGKDVIALAKKNGFNYIDDRAGFDRLAGGAKVQFPVLGLFADADIPYEIDRRNENDVYPSLHEMAETAMKALSEATKDSEKGFFLMIEGSRIDHAGHHNDPAAQVHEVLAYDKAFQSVLDFLEHDKTQAVMVSTSDHETGGLAAARRKIAFLS